jgi:hypothetical protein
VRGTVPIRVPGPKGHPCNTSCRRRCLFKHASMQARQHIAVSLVLNLSNPSSEGSRLLSTLRGAPPPLPFRAALFGMTCCTLLVFSVPGSAGAREASQPRLTFSVIRGKHVVFQGQAQSDHQNRTRSTAVPQDPDRLGSEGLVLVSFWIPKTALHAQMGR